MYKKLALAVLIASTSALGSNISPAYADTLTGCNVAACSDAFSWRTSARHELEIEIAIADKITNHSCRLAS
jgi:hypothetical protein